MGCPLTAILTLYAELRSPSLYDFPKSLDPPEKNVMMKLCEDHLVSAFDFS